jgi:alpha-N-arabinofuranosidase
MKISFDEYNAWPGGERLEPHLPVYTLEDALVVGMFLNAFIRNADLVTLANMAQLVNVLPPVVAKPDGVLLQSIFFPLELIANLNGTVALDAWVDCETFDSERYGKVPYLDVSASHDPDKGLVTLNLINRDKDYAAPVKVELGPGKFADRATLHHVMGDGPKAQNTFKEPDNVSVVKLVADATGRKTTVELPPCSVTVMRVPVA